MKKQMMTKLIGGLVILSMIIATPATVWVFHQPKTPDILR